MTQTQQDCSSPGELVAFLRGRLGPSEESQLQSHLDDCSVCRERLENAAADANSWNEAGLFLKCEVEHLSTENSSDRHEEETQSSLRIRQVLSSLRPTDDPESLGRIGGYEVTGVVGAGGMGVVLKAHDRSLDRIVAIKIMSPHLASSGSARRRFAREAKAAAAVLHPNVIAIHSVTSDEDCPYLVMPYVPGASLQKRIDTQGPLPLKDMLRIGSQIAAGLAAAHGQGLVHRDIKPANILLEEGVERVTITDFGLARAVDDASMTCSGVIAGTPQYMSPEQARGEAVDARSDLFSLGSVMYSMCAGRPPFRAETTYGVLHRIANDSPTPIHDVNSDVPLWLGRIVGRLMAKRHDDRFESAAEVAELLEGCLAHLQQPAAIPLPAGVEFISRLSPAASTLEESSVAGSGGTESSGTESSGTGAPVTDLPVMTSSPVKSPEMKSAGQRLQQLFRARPPVGRVIAAGAFAFSLIIASVVIVLELNKGTLTIESDVENVPIRIMQGDKVVDRMTVTKTGHSVRVAAGDYLVELDGEFDGMVVENRQVVLKRGSTESVKIRHTVTESGSVSGPENTRFETPEALMQHAAECQNNDDVAGFMDCWSDEPVQQIAVSYLLMSITQLQDYESNSTSGRPHGYAEQMAELKRIFAEELSDTDAGTSALALAIASKEIADRAGNEFAETVDTSMKSPLMRVLAIATADHLRNPRRFVVRIAALHEKYGEPDEDATPRNFDYTVEQDGDHAVATDRTRGNQYGLINTDTGWQINDPWYQMKSQEEPAAEVPAATVPSVVPSTVSSEVAEVSSGIPGLVGNSDSISVDATAQSLQGVWEFISVESDGVVTEYSMTIKEPDFSARLTIAGDVWEVNAGQSSGRHRVKIHGHQLTFYGVTAPNGMSASFPGFGNGSQVPTIGYGLFKLEDDTLIYLMTPAMAGVDATGQSELPIKMPETFETRGTQNKVFRLRRVSADASQGDGLNSSIRVPAPKSSPEFPPVRIAVHDEEGKPLEGVQVSLFQVPTKEGGKIVEISETSDAQGLAVNRRLPFGHYEISARTMDGWYLAGHGSRINVEFEKGFDMTLVVPVPCRVGKLIIGSDLGIRSALITELRFGELQEPRGIGYSVGYAPEPEADRLDNNSLPANAASPSGAASSHNGNYETFPTVANGIEQVGAEIRLKISRTIQQPALTSSQHVNTEWQWSPGNTTTFFHRYLIADGKARGFEDGVSEGKSLDRNPAQGSEFFRFSSGNYRVGGALLSLSEAEELPLELDIPTGRVRVFVERFSGRPNDVVLRSLSWRSQDNQPELWLHAKLRRQSAWIERIMDTAGWTYSVPGEDGSTLSGHLLQREHSLQPGEIFELWPKTNHEEAAHH